MTENLIAVRCYTCGKVIGNLSREYENLIHNGVSPENALNSMGLYKYCCRMRVISQGKVSTNVDRQQPSYVEKYDGSGTEPVINELENNILPSIAPLDIMNHSSVADDEISLPSILSVALPEIDDKKPEPEITRWYKSW